MDEQLLTTGTPWKGLLRFALPLMAANILQQLYNTVDTIVVGNLDSQDALSAVGSCGYLIGLYLAIAVGFSLGAGVLVAQLFGAKDEIQMKKHAGASIIFLLLIGVLTTAFAFLTNRFWLTSVLTVPESLMELCMRYMTFYSVGLIFQFGYNIVAAILRAIGDSKSSLYFLLITSVLNIVLDVVFVGVFHWSVMGVALSTTISQIVSMIVSFVYMFKKYPVFRPEKAYWKWDGAVIKSVFFTGIPMAIQQIIINCGFMLLQRLVNSFDDTALIASFTVACRLECYMLMPMAALGNAMSTYSGQNLGARKVKRILDGTKQTVVVAVLFAAVIGAVCFMIAPVLIGFFGLEGKAVEYCIAHVRLVCFDLLLYALYQPFIGLYQGIGKGHVSMVLFGIELGSRVAFAYLLSGWIGQPCVWCEEPLAYAAIVIAAFVYFFFGKWKKEMIQEVKDAKEFMPA